MSLLLAKYAKEVQVVEADDHFVGIISAYIEENRIKNIHIYEDYASVPCHKVYCSTYCL